MTTIAPADLSQRDAEIAARFTAGETLRELAEKFGLSTRTVDRALHRQGVHPVREPIDKDEVRRLMHDGMPATWAAETMGKSSDRVSAAALAIIPGRGKMAREWSSVWSEIRNRPDLLALHREFAPPSPI